MKKTIILLTALTIGLLTSCNQSPKQNTQNETVDIKIGNPILGKWVRIGHSGPICFDFKETGLIEADFGNDQTIDVVTKYELSGDTIKFIDKDGNMCQGMGLYKVYQKDYYVSFDLIEDDCGGRIKTTMGFWTKPNFEELVKQLEEEVKETADPELYLNRARIFMATGMMDKAKADFDTYILSDSLNARAYINRAGTKFPFDLKGVVSDCNKAIAIMPNSMNAYFLRGLARYELGEKEEGCNDFNKAIELGFSVLRVAEQEKCIEYWSKE